MPALLTIVLAMCAVVAAMAHPSCIKYPGPISHKEPLGFCTMYSNYSCCSVKDDWKQMHLFSKMSTTVLQDHWNESECAQYVKELLCQNCSPYAGHIFDNTVSRKGKTKYRFFPGLCNSYCENVYYKCKDILKYFVRKHKSYKKEMRTLLRKILPSSPTDFCAYVAAPDSDYCYPDVATSDLLAGKNTIKQVNEAGCLCLREVAAQIRMSVFAVHAGDGTERLFVGEMLGKVLILFPRQSQKELPVFMNIEHLVFTGNGIGVGFERGLLGMTFHPNYTTNGLFYLSYSTKSDSEGSDHMTRLSEFTVSKDNPNIGNVSSERVLLDIQQPYSYHNGGNIFFADGYLHVIVGDGGEQGDPHNFSQNKSVYIGKTLRIDVNTKSPGKEYGIPEDNPFSDGVEGLPEIYTLGWRNPWKCGVDPGDRFNKMSKDCTHSDTPTVAEEGYGRIICGDVGDNNYEEINLLVKGGNYGWSGFEGENCYEKKMEYCKVLESAPNIQKPIFTYDHKTGKCVITGQFYRGCSIPSLNGYYIYADRTKRGLFKLIFDKSTEEWKSQPISMCGPDVCSFPNKSIYDGRINSFGQDENGEVYFITFNKNKVELSAPFGHVYQFVDPARRISMEGEEYHSKSRMQCYFCQ